MILLHVSSHQNILQPHFLYLSHISVVLSISNAASLCGRCEDLQQWKQCDHRRLCQDSGVRQLPHQSQGVQRQHVLRAGYQAQ